MTEPQSNSAHVGLEDIYRLVGLKPPSLSRAEVHALSGVDPAQSLRWWRAMGFPEVADGETAFGREDVDIVERLQVLLGAGVVSDDDILRLARIMGASSSRLVEAQLAGIPELLAAMDEQGNPSDALRPLTVDPESGVIAFVEGTMNYVWRRQLLAALADQLSVGDSDGLQAVGFADLSGFSKVVKKASRQEIAEIIDTFEATAFDVVSAHDARVVKLIGDEVMFVAERLDDAVDIAIDLLSRLQALDWVPPVHCGVAFGPTVGVGGDVFGPTVNLASRLTGVARPDSIVIARTGGKHLFDRRDLDVRAVRRPYDLKGIGHTRVISIRPARPEPEGEADPR